MHTQIAVLAFYVFCTPSFAYPLQSTRVLPAARLQDSCLWEIYGMELESLVSIKEIYELAMRPVLSLYNILIALAVNSQACHAA